MLENVFNLTSISDYETRNLHVCVVLVSNFKTANKSQAAQVLNK